jgi:hypothetical protein
MVGLGGTASVGEEADIIILLWGDLLLMVEVMWSRTEASFWVGPLLAVRCKTLRSLALAILRLRVRLDVTNAYDYNYYGGFIITAVTRRRG